MALPTEPVGSLPRAAKLQQALADYDAGKLSHQQLTREQDAACLDSIKRVEATGSPIARDIAFQKIKARVEGTRMAAEKLGLA
jgi:hypothetical protein